ncbi:hypothetical protein DGMP_01660 [Desulfomarina profundi]|uniref:Uncharacterized protein n=2 Tax=Desulfomarina profundi TaxID=2772557 RepID=A0A8D5FDV4_9BACT|nr:hypothetical protein DGMP_01660 [Desulfomarina profundi]
MDKPVFEYYQIEEVAKKANLSTRDLFEYCRQDSLNIQIQWGKARRLQRNQKCQYEEEWRPLEIYYDLPIIRPKSPCENCQYLTNKDASTCFFNYEQEYLEQFTHEEIAELGSIDINNSRLWVHKDDLKNFLSAQTNTLEETITVDVTDKTAGIPKLDSSNINDEEFTESERKKYLKIIGALIAINYDAEHYNLPSGPNASQITETIHSKLKVKDFNINGIGERTIRDIIKKAWTAIQENKV